MDRSRGSGTTPAFMDRQIPHLTSAGMGIHGVGGGHEQR